MRALSTVLLLLMLSGCASLLGPQADVHIADIHSVGKPGLFEQEFELALRINNPDTHPLTGQGIRLAIRLDGSHFANAFSNSPIEVAPLSSSLVKLRFHTSPASWLPQIGKLLSGNSQLNYELDGNIIGGKGLGDLPFRSQGSWQGRN